MLNNRLIIRYLVLIISLLSLISSCKKEEDRISYSYFVSKDEALSLTTTYIKKFISDASAYYPLVGELNQYIVNDIIIYRIIYNTIVDGEKVKASGLVCVPAKSGEYPVLSFQNGTNTQNTLAPSNYVLNPSYQMVEAIASMGYVVLIADYPGFGESVQIAHPYLVTEPTVRSLVDMLFAVREISGAELNGIVLKNEYYLLGYSQGGWATLALHKALELDYATEFNLAGSACGAGPYNIYSLFQGITTSVTYPMPVYLGYILNAYSSYKQFTNPVTDIFKDPYAARVSTLYKGTLTFDQINSQLTTSIAGLVKEEFLSGFGNDAKYSTVRDALNRNTISGWNTKKPVLFLHGGGDTQVSPLATENIYNAMISAGTTTPVCKKEIIPGLDHGDGVVPCMVKGLLFLINLKQ
jgi:pimeloyl-ACP methyl ester carboxylesterase